MSPREPRSVLIRSRCQPVRRRWPSITTPSVDSHPTHIRKISRRDRRGQHCQTFRAPAPKYPEAIFLRRRCGMTGTARFCLGERKYRFIFVGSIVGRYFNSCACSRALSVFSLSRPVVDGGFFSDPSMKGKFGARSVLVAGAGWSGPAGWQVSSVSLVSSMPAAERTWMRLYLLRLRWWNVDDRRQHMMS